MQTKIQLTNTWWLDESARLGSPGGFGEVFRGKSASGEPVAIKRLLLQAHGEAHRELRIASDLSNRSLDYVVPILDSGQDPTSKRYFVVMPEASGSLQDFIDEREQISPAETASVALSIARGLAELPDLVHRDLKPANVLLIDGTWKIADFGIAKFVEESTSIQTLRACLSYPYAAPEQWQHQKPTRATDIYALGCILHCLLTGHPPFRGPAPEDYAVQHLKEPPPHLESSIPHLRTLV